MTQIPAGWYPDPDPSQPEPRGQRYWDGQQWTEHVSPPAGQPTPYAPTTPYGGAMPTTGVAGPATTPDGQELAGWWARFAAWLIDGIIVAAVTVLVGLPWVTRIVEAYADFFDEAMDAAAEGSSPPDSFALMSDLTGPFLSLTLVSLLVGLAYHAGFLKWRAATPGKLLLGLRVRLREVPGPLTWGTIVVRWASQFAYTLLTLVPILGTVAGLYPLIDGLWPLWDGKKQAIHDKAAKTNVVRRRR